MSKGWWCLSYSWWRRARVCCAGGLRSRGSSGIWGVSLTERAARPNADSYRDKTTAQTMQYRGEIFLIL